jgi:FtsP/CotA-like multicopper oxidase with cupredoxin domain
VAIDGSIIDRTIKDTILISPIITLTIQFDADNPGVWQLHCHLLYYQEGGMMTLVRYDNFIQPLICE